ncbi:MAG TPA: hypothetical protein VGS41_06170, partial [Chthonomonadales bacterium]|nr:hypothetical protein [Chthonomonadales bacterium]
MIQASFLLLLSIAFPAGRCDAAAIAEREASLARDAVVLTNRLRVRNGLPPLRSRKILCTTASWLANDMARYHYFAHVDHHG